MSQCFPMEKHSFGEFPVTMKPRFNILQNPLKTGFILCSCTYKQFYSSLLSLYSKKYKQIQTLLLYILIMRMSIFASGNIMQGIRI